MARTIKFRLFVTLGTTIATFCMLLAGMAPASAAEHASVTTKHTYHQPTHQRTIDYVNLGDSYSAGFGSGMPTATSIPGCLQGTGASHVTKLDALRGINLTANVACAGATTTDIASMAAFVAPQLAQAELVTLTLGANDLDIRGLVTACSRLGTDAACDQALALGAMAIPAVAASAHQTLRVIDQLTPGKIMVLGYPRLFSISKWNQQLITSAHAAKLNKLGDMLNAAIRTATYGTHANYVSVTRAFNGHGIGARNSWIYFNTANALDPFNLHPTTTGYIDGYYPAAKRQLRNWHLIR